MHRIVIGDPQGVRHELSKHPCWRNQATLHGVVFDILVGSEHRVGVAAVLSDDDRKNHGDKNHGDSALNDHRN